MKIIFGLFIFPLPSLHAPASQIFRTAVFTFKPGFRPFNVHEIYPLSHWPGRKGYVIYNPDGLQGCFFGETQKYPEHKSESPAVIRVHILGDSRSQNIALTAMPSVSLCIATQEEETSGGATS